MSSNREWPFWVQASIVIGLIVMVLASGGCASNMTEYERADRMNIVINDYNRCKESRDFWIEDGSIPVPLPKRYHDLKRELLWNDCPRVKQ